MKSVTAFAVLCVSALAACSSTTYRDTDAPIDTVGQVDLTKYAGRWYEIARFPNSFEKGCANVTADYSLRADGDVTVLNTCDKNGEVTTAEGIATSVSPDNDKLSVDFVPWVPFTNGDYWILDVTDDYSVAVVGAPAGTTGWILARSPELSPTARAAAEAVLVRNGYDVERLYDTPQSER